MSNPATVHGMNMSAAVAVTGLVIGNALRKAHVEARERRQERAEQTAQLQALATVTDEAQSLGDIALQLVGEIKALRAQNASLTAALAQRQAYIERMRTH
ncbi:hypothetical protein MRBLMR1_001709 [Neorhizobium sp. LMR1-1-1.1]